MQRSCLFALSVAMAVAIILLSPACASAPAEARLGQQFSLSIGQSASISGEDLQIKFLEVIEDSRCPKDVVCVWAGRVSGLVEITKDGSPYRMVLTQPGLSGDSAREIYREYQLAFRVEPYPQAGRPIPKDAYRLVLVVTRRSQ